MNKYYNIMEKTETININSFIEDLKLKNSNIRDYIDSLNTIEYKALEISIRELESSFSIEKSIGYINYIKNYPTP